MNNISNKQKDILLLIYRFRFLNRVQIQKLLKHKSTNRINTWLKDLVDKKYLGRKYENKIGENIIPARYYIGLNGIRFLKTQSHCQKEYLAKLYTEDKKSDQFINSSLFIANIYIELLEKVKTFEFHTQSDFPLDGILRSLMPDFAFVIKEDQKENYYFGEIFKEHILRHVTQGRIRRYIKFFTEEAPDSNPNLIFICPSQSLQDFVKKFSEELLENEDVENINVIVTTHEEAVKKEINSLIESK